MLHFTSFIPSLIHPSESEYWLHHHQGVSDVKLPLSFLIFPSCGGVDLSSDVPSSHMRGPP